MGEDKFVKKKAVKTERRFLDRSTPIDDDDGMSNFSLEIFHDCSFFNHHQDSTSAVDRFVDDDDDGGGSGGGDMTAEERRIYWESQHFLLQEILEQYHSIGSKLRQEIKRQINIARESGFCNCERHCTTLCLRRATLNQLSTKGFNADLCVSRWKTTHNTPAGWHEYIEVRANTVGKKSQIPFVVEVGFRDEFRMAKACEEYNTLIQQLPEMYIGKWEHMQAMIRLVCEAARKSADEQNIHMGPWRKKKFMLMKWSPSTSFSNQQRLAASASSFPLSMPATLKVA